MTDPGAQKTYLLPRQQAEHIFFQDIKPDVLTGARRQRRPEVIILSAQAGAGKTALARELADNFADRGGVVQVDVDMFKTFHPKYRELQFADERTADDLVHADARRWFEWSLDDLAEQRVNVIVEHGLRSREVTNSLLERFATKGYNIKAAFMGTPDGVSRLGILERYQVAHDTIGFGRYVPEDLHDERYRHLLDVADWLDADRRVSAISVYQRDGRRVHRNERAANGEWRVSAATRTELRSAREQQLSVEESRAFLRLHGSLVARMDSRWSGPLRRARVAAAPVLNPDADLAPTSDKTAVTYGRYQLVSVLHVDNVRSMLHEWPRVVVGVIDPDAEPPRPPNVPPHLRDYYRISEANAEKPSPMTPAERAGFWRAALEAAGLAGRVSVEVIPRPTLDPDGFNARFPPAEFDVVFPLASGDEQSHDARGEILGRRVYTVDPPLQYQRGYHTSDIRDSYQRGGTMWRRGVAPGALEAFIAADGPRRLLAPAAESRREERGVEAGSTVPELRERIAAYEREAARAPAWVGEQLRDTALAAGEYRRQATLRASEAEAEAATDRQRRAELQAEAQAYSKMADQLDQAQRQLEQIDAARSEWYLRTAEIRGAADAARAELEARGEDIESEEAQRAADRSEPATDATAADQQAREQGRTEEPDAEANRAGADRGEPAAGAEPEGADAEPLTDAEPARVEWPRDVPTLDELAAEVQKAREATRMISERKRAEVEQGAAEEEHRRQVDADLERRRAAERENDGL